MIHRVEKEGDTYILYVTRRGVEFPMTTTKVLSQLDSLINYIKDIKETW